MAPTPSPRPMTTPSRTPNSKHRLNLTQKLKDLSIPTEHPVEVITRIRNHPDPKNPRPDRILEASANNNSIRVRFDNGYRDFSLDGVSFSEREDLDAFYKKYVGSRIEGVKTGSKCTIMMYGPTGAGKSHTMFGCPKEPGIVYRALRDILRKCENGDDLGFGGGVFVQVAVLEIYNEEIYDLLGANLNNTPAPKGICTPKVRLEVMGKRAKNATYISGTEAGKISREVSKVEKRRIVKSTNCNERSSRSHCLIILDVPSVGGRLMLVDMAGSENIEQAGQTGFEAKLQTAKINQGNTALKRVVESIANGDSHVPFRDSKLTMLLQDSFEDDKSKILMILCASPDPKEMHKTISTLEYGAKAKCIVRAAHMSTPKDKTALDESSTFLRARIAAMNQFIYSLQAENKLREKERDSAHKELAEKEEEILKVKSLLKVAEEEVVEAKVEERTYKLKSELRKMEEKMKKQEEEIEILKSRVEEMELEKSKRNMFYEKEALNDIDGGRFVKKLYEIYQGEEAMEKSMELDMGDQNIVHDVREINNPCLSTVFEREDEGEETENVEEDYEVDKEVVEESNVRVDNNSSSTNKENKDSIAVRKTRIQNIFRLCGNYREVTQGKVVTPVKKYDDENSNIKTPLSGTYEQSPMSSILASLASLRIEDESKNDGEEFIEVCVKWEASKEYSGSIIKKFKVLKNSSLNDLRKLIEIQFGEENEKQSFVFLLLGEPSGAPVTKEKERTIPICKLPICNNQLNTHLACLRPISKTHAIVDHIPFANVENIMPISGH